MSTIIILSIVTTIFIAVYLFIAREKTKNGKTPSNFAIIAIVSMIAGMILGFSTGSGWAYALIAHGMLGLGIGIVRLYWKKKENEGASLPINEIEEVD